MRLDGTASWRIGINSASSMMECALWIRAVERLRIPEDPLVRGPLDIDRPPPPISTGDQVICEQWLGWWYSLVAPRRPRRPHDLFLEPAHDTPDPLGLAPHPVLAALVTRRWPQAQQWQVERHTWQAERGGHRVTAADGVLRDLARRKRVPGWAGWLRDLVTQIG